MKRCWIGVGLLAWMLAAALAVSCAMPRLHRPVAQQLHQASALAQQGQMEQAQQAAAQARTAWACSRTLRAMVSDHTPSEEIDSAFSELTVWGQQQKAAAFAALCARTAALVEAMADSHTLSWQNFL